MDYRTLDWDSNFFGISVGEIVQPEPEMLLSALSELREGGIKLVYCASDQALAQDCLTQFGGLLADKKTTLTADFDIENLNGSAVDDDLVEPYTDSMPMGDFEHLAVQSGEYSRFSIDPKLPRDKFISLYKTWIDKSLKKEIASEVLVIHDNDSIAGMVTLGDKSGRGDIGLIAVGTEYRGKGYGYKLVRAAQQWFVEHGYERGQVVTQGNNHPAVNLYKKCGYEIEKVEHFYHFWL